MANGASSYRRFRDNGDISSFDEMVMVYSDGLIQRIYPKDIKY